jgi:hypothetical protein
MDLGGEQEKILSQDAVLGASLFRQDNFYRIKVFSEDFFSENVLLFHGKDGELLANRLPYRFVPGGVLGFELSSKPKRVLLWTKNTLGILDFFKNRPEEETIFEPAPELVWLIRERENIEQAFWVYEGSHVLFRDQNKIFLMELETYGKPVLHELFEVKNNSSIFYSDESGKLFFIEPETGHLASISLLSKWEILPPSFPEPKEEKRKFKIIAL